MSAGVEVDVGSAVIEYRVADGQTAAQAAHRVSLGGLFDAAPWRTFRWYQGQRHYSGKYWSVTENDHVVYESRLELSALLMADFDLAVNTIKAQLFRLTALAGSRRRWHVPDYLFRPITLPPKQESSA
ncbi:hypothetical protein [[Mycobacterium] appelbergii]|uniref:hypothetical protein n=1 Tax=[Mycobacterium] appelbergii TaxID=2939269 RepID=UPI002938F876|nr:hypothetical protein [Mycobacterium sp. 21AC1]